jgi:hypothetical protein
VAGEVGLAWGWGCGIPEPLGIVAEFPDNPYVPSLCGATLGRTSRASRTASPTAAGYSGHST